MQQVCRAPKQTSQHILYECRTAKHIWSLILVWLRRVEEKPALQLTCEATLFGVVPSTGDLVSKQQWWPPLRTAAVYEIWKNWNAEVYGGQAEVSAEAMLCRIWDRVITAGAAIQQGRATRVKKAE